MLPPLRFRARSGARYQCLPTVETKPKDPGAPSTITLPIVTNSGDQTKNHVVLHVSSPTKPYQEHRYPVLAVRNPLVHLVWTPRRLPGPTNQLIWLHRRSIVLLPIISGRGVKYTHNDINDTVLHTDSGPTRMGLIPEASDPKKVVMQDPHVIAINRRPQHIDAVFRFTIKWLIVANIVVGTFTLVNLVIYPKYIYERPVPVLSSKPANQLHPYEI